MECAGVDAGPGKPSPMRGVAYDVTDVDESRQRRLVRRVADRWWWVAWVGPRRGLRPWISRRPREASALLCSGWIRPPGKRPPNPDLGLARTFQRNAVAEILDPLSIFVQHFVLVGTKPSRGETIHGDSMFAPVVCKAHGQLPDAAAARAIGTEAGIPGNAGHRTDIDDAPVAARNHVTHDGLRDKKTSAQVRVENQVPIVPGDFQRGFADVATGIVDENIQVAKRGRRVFRKLLNA